MLLQISAIFPSTLKSLVKLEPHFSFVCMPCISHLLFEHKRHIANSFQDSEKLPDLLCLCACVGLQLCGGARAGAHFSVETLIGLSIPCKQV